MKKSSVPPARVRRTVTRGVVITTALAATLGAAVPGVLAAGPTAEASTRAAGIGTTDTQRVNAAAVVRLDPTADVLLLSDYDFIHALWQKARDAGELLDSVRVAAEQAMFSSAPADHVAFIVTGVHDAYRLDQQRERDKAEAERAARLAKTQALQVVGIPSTPELLALNDDNFIRAVIKHAASGPEVRAAGIRALAGEPAEWREYIVNGVREAHRTDVANELKELEERDREEAERQRELAARKTAAALFRITPTEGMLVLSSDNFIRELLRLAPADLHGSELYAAAQRAVLNPSPDAWKAFIHTGADAAYKLDDENRRKKAAEADRRLALQIQAAAENGGMHPNLVAAAKKALAGTDAQVAAFLKEDTQYRLKRQSIQSLDVDATGWNIRQSAADKGEAFITPVDSRSPLADREDATWTVVPSLAGRPGCWSFESARKPGYYLMATLPSLRLKIAADDRTSAFRTNATWCNRKNGSATGFVWGAGPEERWMVHRTGSMYSVTSSVSQWIAKSGVWKIAPPLAP
ncbi:MULTISPECIES: AbfB domain-containing protein [Streptomyces]|uniref:AbfB domain-containing protein n=1 Tax=Streptomyces TaxID=1883 RepID=UPI0015C41474|nr:MULTISPECIES: AbfB domain-containing protein [Streptomyces]MDW4897097.1 AbfB domain-containing protein [Streptomyces californicus]QLG30466.1 AbfB domain-containing protein [Streptomyces sp. CB04723]